MDPKEERLIRELEEYQRLAEAQLKTDLGRTFAQLRTRGNLHPFAGRTDREIVVLAVVHCAEAVIELYWRVRGDEDIRDQFRSVDDDVLFFELSAFAYSYVWRNIEDDTRNDLSPIVSSIRDEIIKIIHEKSALGHHSVSWFERVGIYRNELEANFPKLWSILSASGDRTMPLPAREALQHSKATSVQKADPMGDSLTLVVLRHVVRGLHEAARKS